VIFAVVSTLSRANTSVFGLRHVAGPAWFRRLARRRLRHLRHDTRAPTPTKSPRASRRPTPARDNDERLADVLDAVGRELRLGASLHAALVAAIERHSATEWEWLRDAARGGHDLHQVISQRIAAQGDDFSLRVIAAAADGGDAVHAVESAARTLRTTAAIAADARTAVAHTASSIRVLTWVPVAIALWLVWRDADARMFYLSRAGVLCVAAGALLQLVGRRTVRRMARHATRVNAELPDFVDLVSVHLRSGKPPALAFLYASDSATGDTGDSARRVADAVRNGTRFVDALVESRTQFGLRAQTLVDALVDTERDGLPPRELFERLASDAKDQRRREAERRIRALPVRLTLPLVGCILPSYLLLAVIPLLASQFSSVTLDLH
jgi:Flp pilus assembly protein TadB